MKMEQRQSQAKLEGSMGFGDERQITQFSMIRQKKEGDPPPTQRLLTNQEKTRKLEKHLSMRKRALAISISLTNQQDLGTRLLNGRCLQYLSVYETLACCKPAALQCTSADEKHTITFECFIFVTKIKTTKFTHFQSN